MPNENREKFLLVRIRVFKDEGAFESLLSEYAAPLQRFLYSKLPSAADVEDAYSALLLRLWEYATSTPVDHFSGLAHTIARGIIAEFYRTREKIPHVAISEEYEDHGVQVESHETVEGLEARIDVTWVKDALKKLTNEDDREVIILRFLEGYAVKDIAKYIGKTPNATSVLLNRALKKLRSILNSKPL
ncbi:MAG: sigma-70 family RNA polymerase sigma factor [Patescibacteria group bacterium]